MSKRLAFLFPGQGAQYVGMGQDFFQKFSVARETFEEADDILQISLSKIIFDGPSEVLTETRFSQPAIFVTSIALLRVLQHEWNDIKPSVCAGLSLGEYTALHAADRLGFEETLKLVQARGQAMHDASLKHPGGLAVVLGLDAIEVAPVIAPISNVWIANLNCPKQVVISGSHEALAKASELLKAHGAKRVLPLDVSGAFHSGLMQDAKERLAPLIYDSSIASSSTGFVMNVPGDYVELADEMKKYLVDQVISTTRWEDGIKKIEERGVDLYIEIGCGKTLSGMNRKIGALAPIASLEKLQDLEEIDKALTAARA